jgi:hypothetical protein
MTSEGIEIVPLCFLTSHLLILPIRLSSVVPPLVAVAGIVIVEPEVVIEGIAETEG